MSNGRARAIAKRIRYVRTDCGRTSTDSCEIRAKLPEIAVLNPYCHVDLPFKTQVKGLASYTVPKVDLLLSGTFHSVPYPGNNFPSVTSQSISGVAIIAPEFQTNLGRALSSGIPIEFVNTVKPGALYGDRLTQIDMRIGKNIRYGRTKSLVALDIFNLFNSNTPDVYQQSYTNPSTYLNPLSITVGRFFKISGQIDF